MMLVHHGRQPGHLRLALPAATTAFGPTSSDDCRLTEDVVLTAGYRAQQWWGLREGTFLDANSGFSLTADPDKLVGPFVRLGIYF